MKLGLFVVVLCSFVATELFAIEPDARKIIESISTPLDQPVVFTEKRMNPMFSDPITISGVVELSSDGTLSKIILEPFSELISISSQSVTLERGGKRQVMTLRADSELWQFYMGLRAVLGGDPEGVADVYRVNVLQVDAEWWVELQPRSERMGQIVETLTVKGSQGKVRYVRTQQAANNWSELVFQHQEDASVVTERQ
jgi:hypothetical protein